jgi:hypothetical protein
MKKIFIISLCLMFALIAIAFARNAPKKEKQIRVETPHSASNLDLPSALQGFKASAQIDTFVLGQWDFDEGGAECDGTDEQGWTRADLTAQLDCFFHIDDFNGISPGNKGYLVPIEGLQSLWCGARRDSSLEGISSYATLPGYGNEWDQSWFFKCITAGPSDNVTIKYYITWDSEPNYDNTTVEYATKSTCDSLDIEDLTPSDWNILQTYNSNMQKQYGSYTILASEHQGAIRFRFHFVSDVGWSDEDGLYESDGACIFDSVHVYINSNVVDYEDFEDEAVGDTQTVDGDWFCQTPPSYSSDGMAIPHPCDTGDNFYACLYNGMTLAQEGCIDNLTCCWAFISGSNSNYVCGGHPQQWVVPYENDRGQFIKEEIWSPRISWGTGTGSEVQLVFDVYRDLSLSSMVFYVWHIRSLYEDGRIGEWRDRDLVYYGKAKDWHRQVEAVGDLIDTAAVDVQVALGCWDLCGYWCNVFRDGSCHSHSPLFDNVELRRIGTEGPQWSTRDINLFQDTWTTAEFLLHGSGRIDAAVNRAWIVGPNYVAGDSAVVSCMDLDNGIGTDPNPSVYCYLNPRRGPCNGSTGESFDSLAAQGGPRWPWLGLVVCTHGTKWYKYRCDYVYEDTDTIPNKFCIDFNDNYFNSCDTLEFFFGADNAVGQGTFWRQGCLDGEPPVTTTRLDEACVCPMEMQILPGAGWYRGGDILYVDQFSGRGAQPYFDWAFRMLGIDRLVDRFDKRGPGSTDGNGIENLCNNVQLKLINNYRKIIWNSGDLSAGTVGDKKSDDYSILFAFLDLHSDENGAGIYFSGDDLAQELNGMTTASSLQFKNVYMPHALITGDHNDLHRFSPLGIGEGAGAGVPPSVGVFEHGPPIGVDTIVVYGGCPIINDFDVIAPVGTATLEMCYDPVNEADDSNPAIVAFDSVNANSYRVATVLSGFSLHYIRDDKPAGVPDHADHMYHIISYLGNTPNEPTAIKPGTRYTNSLAQNYPNPFNPSTTIKYSVKEKAHVSMKIYNVAGQLVRTLVNSDMNAGAYIETWNGRSNSGDPVSSGIYFYRLVTKNFSMTKKMVFLK